MKSMLPILLTAVAANCLTVALLSKRLVEPVQLPSQSNQGRQPVQKAPEGLAAVSASKDEGSLYDLPGSWTDQKGQKLTLASLKGKVRVVSMVYTRCKTACPRIVADLKAIEAQCERRFPGRVGFVLISMDPAADSPAVLERFAVTQKLRFQWKLLRGSQEQVQNLAAVLGFQYRRISPTDFVHSNLVTVLSPGGAIVHQQEGLGVDPGETLAAIEELVKAPLPLKKCCEGKK